MCKKVYMQEIYYSQNTEKLLICGLVEGIVYAICNTEYQKIYTFLCKNNAYKNIRLQSP